MKKSFIVGIGLLIILAIAAVFLGYQKMQGTKCGPDEICAGNNSNSDTYDVVPDVQSATSSKSTVLKPTESIGINEKVILDGVSVMPISIIEDSRCPAIVECIQAGRLRVQVIVDATSIEMELGKPLTYKQKIITLEKVPIKMSVSIPDNDFWFIFSINNEASNPIVRCEDLPKISCGADTTPVCLITNRWACVVH